MKKLIALLLVLAMCMTVFGGCRKEESASIRRKPTETTETTEPSFNPEDRVPLIPELDEDADVLTFRFEEAHEELYYEKLEQFEQAALDNDANAVAALEMDLDELDEFIQDQSAIAEVLHYCNTKDEEAADLHLEMTETLTDMIDANLETFRRVYQSDSKVKDQIFGDWSQADIDYMLGYTDEVKELTKRKEEILVEFREMTDEELDEDIGELYAELVSIHNRIAEIFGYDNYYEYSYEVIRERDYAIEDVEQLRTYTQKYVKSIFDGAIEGFSMKYQSLTAAQQLELEEFLFADYDDADYLEDYLDALPDDMGEEMESMLDGHVVFPKGSKAREGAFTTLIGGHPFCYFSKDYKTTDTLVHEMGHYYGGLHGNLYEMPLDLAEVQSQGNEWLMIVYAGDELDEEVYQCYLDYRIANDVVTILVSVIVDEFEERVYTAEGVEDFETEDFERIMAEVCESYGGLEVLYQEVVDMQAYWRQVVLESPVYYISYAMSMVPSLDLFFCASEEWDDAVEIYQKITWDIADDATFLGILEDAGLATPFDDTLFNKLLTRYDLFTGDSYGTTEENAA